MRNRKGFTLVEIMIVVAIIGLLAAIAIPSLLRARHNANEAAAIGSTKTLSTALESFKAAQTPPTYPSLLTELSDAAPPYVDSVLAGGSKQGYNFTYTAGDADDRGAVNTFTILASPIVSGTTGTRTFFVDESGVIRASAEGDADVDSSPIE